MEKTAELDTKQEEAPTPNGHDASWKIFDSDQDLLQHILAMKPAEEVVEVPEWNVKILCRALNAKDLFEIQELATNKEAQRYDYLPHLPQVVMCGCYNPTTEKPVFLKESYSSEKERKAHEAQMRSVLSGAEGVVVARLGFTILRLSRMLSGNVIENAKKN